MPAELRTRSLRQADLRSSGLKQSFPTFVGGKEKDRATSRVSAKTLQGFVGERAAKGATVYTDDHGGYHGMPFEHETVKHSISKSGEEMARQFVNVISRVEPVAEQFCREENTFLPFKMAESLGFVCDIQVMYENLTLERNAYQLYDDNENPIIVFTISMIADARNEHEIAFILGHEVGHHIGRHIQKKNQQALAGALVLGALTAVGKADLRKPG